ncbi:MAG TPA: protein kinase [Kofleriaceae bacterium]|nr:protein kinase [Kofleriaceae bacterium]
MDAEELPKTDRFEIRRKLGEGGMGVVYEAYDRQRDAVVALKTLRNAHGTALARFKGEFRALQRLEHPNLVALGELITAGKLSFFTMELVAGVALLEYVRRGQEGDEARLRACLVQLAPALAALHASDIVHRDVKPSNILVTDEGRVVLVDLGLALDTRPAVTTSADADIVGTVAYMAPEQAQSGKVGPPADWYSFGVVLYEALTGCLPHSGDSALEMLMNKQHGAPPPPRARVPAVPRDLDQLCEQLLLLDPAERPGQREIFERLGVVGDARVAQGSTPSLDLSADMPFVGREAELLALEATFDEVLAGNTRVVHVEGESGIGKSTLLQELATRLEARRGALVLWGRCYEREQVPYTALDGVIESLVRHLRRLTDAEVTDLLPDDAALLPRLFAMFERVPAIARAQRRTTLQTDPHQMRSRAFTALRALVIAVAKRTPTMLVVDDIQWTDADSLVLLGDLLRPPRPPRLLAILAARPESERAAAQSWRAPLVAALEGTPLAFLRVDPLAESVGAELARTLLGRAAGPPEHLAAAAALARDASGHPLFIAELCRHVAAGRGEHPRQLEELIGARVAALPQASRRLLQIVCLADTPLPPALLGAAAGGPPADLARHLARLRVASLVRTSGIAGHERVAPYHARIAGAVLAGLDDAGRRAGHEALAAALASSPLGRDAPELLLRHLSAAGDAAGAARHAELAADRAATGLAFERAAELYREALRLGAPTGDARRALELRLAAALADAGRGPESAEIFLHAADGADPATRLECRRQAAEQLIITGHLDAGLQALEQLLSESGVTWSSTPTRVLASLLWQRVRLRMRGLGSEQRHATEIAERELRRIDVFRAAGLGLGFIDPVRGADFNARYLRAALAAGEPTRVVPALGAEAIYQATRGGAGLRRARLLLERLRAIAAEHDTPWFRAWASAVDGITEYFACRFTEAIPLMSSATAAFREANASTWERNNIQMLHLLALRYVGDLVGFRALFDTCVRDANRRGDRFLESTARRNGNLIWLAADDPAAAEENLRNARWTPPQGRLHLQHWYELESRGELALYTRDREAARRIAAPLAEFFRSLLPRVATVRIAARWLEARLLIAAGDVAAAQGPIKQLAREELGSAKVWEALARAAIAPAPDAQVAYLRAAITATERTGMSLYAHAARRRLGILLGGTEGDALVAAADAAMRAQGVVDPAHLIEVVAPATRAT